MRCAILGNDNSMFYCKHFTLYGMPFSDISVELLDIL